MMMLCNKLFPLEDRSIGFIYGGVVYVTCILLSRFGDLFTVSATLIEIFSLQVTQKSPRLDEHGTDCHKSVDSNRLQEKFQPGVCCKKIEMPAFQNLYLQKPQLILKTTQKEQTHNLTQPLPDTVTTCFANTYFIQTFTRSNCHYRLPRSQLHENILQMCPPTGKGCVCVSLHCLPSKQALPRQGPKHVRQYLL